MGTEAGSVKKWTVLELLNWTKDFFARSNVESPRLAAEILLAEALSCKRVELYARFNNEPSEKLRTQFRQMVRRTADGEPVAYIVGKREFYSLSLSVTPDVLIPRPETELLVDLSLEFLRNDRSEPAAMWDLCCGSGAVALAVAANIKPNDVPLGVLASDISKAAVEVANKNAADNKLDEKVTITGGDLFDVDTAAITRVSPSGLFDIITANPPYIRNAAMAELPKQVSFEPTLALDGGEDGLDIVRRIIDSAPQHLKPGGMLAIEIGFDQADELWEIIKDRSEYGQKRFVKDSAGIDRIAVLHRSGN